MHPELFTLPGGITITSYGFCMMVGFLSGVWLAMKRAEKVKVDPEIVLNLAFLALVFGVAGSRAFFVIHYWDEQFAGRENLFWAILDVRKGGLEFLGGFIGGAVGVLLYATYKRISTRLFLDILAPSLMWGLAIGRIGCFMNGCCFGGACTLPDSHDAAKSWAVQFPYGSLAHHAQWLDREVTVPAEFIITDKRAPGMADLVNAGSLSMDVARRNGPQLRVRDAKKQLKDARTAEADAKQITQLEMNLKIAQNALLAHDRQHFVSWLASAQRYPSREVPTRATSVSELQDLAAAHRTVFIHPTQLYSSINAFLLYLVLAGLFYVRKRHGVVFFGMLVLYPITRFVIECIRSDNPHDMGGLTISQFFSVSLFLFGVVSLIVIYRFMPERSPLVVPYEPPAEDEQPNGETAG